MLAAILIKGKVEDTAKQAKALAVLGGAAVLHAMRKPASGGDFEQKNGHRASTRVEKGRRASTRVERGCRASTRVEKGRRASTRASRGSCRRYYMANHVRSLRGAAEERAKVRVPIELLLYPKNDACHCSCNAGEQNEYAVGRQRPSAPAGGALLRAAPRDAQGGGVRAVEITTKSYGCHVPGGQGPPRTVEG